MNILNFLSSPNLCNVLKVFMESVPPASYTCHLTNFSNGCGGGILELSNYLIFLMSMKGPLDQGLGLAHQYVTLFY